MVKSATVKFHPLVESFCGVTRAMSSQRNTTRDTRTIDFATVSVPDGEQEGQPIEDIRGEVVGELEAKLSHGQPSEADVCWNHGSGAGSFTANATNEFDTIEHLLPNAPVVAEYGEHASSVPPAIADEAASRCDVITRRILGNKPMVDQFEQLHVAAAGLEAAREFDKKLQQSNPKMHTWTGIVNNSHQVRRWTGIRASRERPQSQRGGCNQWGVRGPDFATNGGVSAPLSLFDISRRCFAFVRSMFVRVIP